ncbi:MAG: VCBS repeat-containing protein [Bacteroidetes bacterium]|nr:VCBS repeat-containing protein [Bacteroidota bacterium]
MKKYCIVLLQLTCSLLIFAQPEPAFQYVESSNGMNNPEWESGKTELEFADINQDGYVDILTIGDHSTPSERWGTHGIMVFFGNGTGSWSLQMNGYFGYGGIAIGDANNDGHWDVGYGMHHAYSSTDFGDQLIEVALGDGTGINWTPWDDGLATNGEDWGMFGTDFADVDNDGDLDIGSNSFGSGSGLHVYLNQGDGTWVQSFGIMEGNSNMRFVFGDINNDGNADFVVTHDAGIAFFGTGDGNFYNADYNLPQYSFPVTGPDLDDIDKDGGKDLSYVNDNGGISVWKFDTGSNQWISLAGTLPASGDYQETQLCDFNSDGTMDIAAFGEANLTIWKGTVTDDPLSVTWTEVFNTLTSNNGDCGAFRAGGDVDRNGYPDITLVEKVGNWPNDINRIKCYKENSPVFLHYIKYVYPRGNEVFRQGSVQFIDWISAVPVSSSSGVKIEYSLQGRKGPYTVLTGDFPNGGRYQWTVPQTISTNNCFIRYTLVDDDDTLLAYTPKPFTILGENGMEADFVADSTLVYPGSEIQFTDLSLGLLTSWEWDFDNDGTVDATERNPVYAYTLPGIYSVKLTVSDGSNTQSEVKTDYITVQSPAGWEEPDIVLESIFPNPVADRLNVTFQTKSITQINFMVIDPEGKPVRTVSRESFMTGKHSIAFSVDDLSSGIYYLLMVVEGNELMHKFVVVR